MNCSYSYRHEVTSSTHKPKGLAEPEDMSEQTPSRCYHIDLNTYFSLSEDTFVNLDLVPRTTNHRNRMMLL